MRFWCWFLNAICGSSATRSHLTNKKCDRTDIHPQTRYAYGTLRERTL
ncbi:hypothetical protein [Argonema galeatum]|nr:hypothetical protein [Argonema galeatum]MCL1466124.1 hypothetical protein [Argonema galeatum A003/A1]